MTSLNFNKGNGLLPAVIQHSQTQQVLMVGYMNEAAYNKTCKEGRVTFFSRTKGRLWTKGETSGNYLYVNQILPDCDKDALLIKVTPGGPVCHTGSYSCFGAESARGFLYRLEYTIVQRLASLPKDSYTAKLFSQGLNRIVQKVGEEAIETVIAAKDDEVEPFRNEVADLLYHLLVLLKAKGVKLEEIEQTLAAREKR